MAAVGTRASSQDAAGRQSAETAWEQSAQQPYRAIASTDKKELLLRFRGVGTKTDLSAIARSTLQPALVQLECAVNMGLSRSGGCPGRLLAIALLLVAGAVQGAAGVRHHDKDSIRPAGGHGLAIARPAVRASAAISRTTQAAGHHQLRSRKLQQDQVQTQQQQNQQTNQGVTGRVSVWGAQLLPAPLEVAAGGVQKIAAGVLHALALKNGSVIAWGDNAFNQTIVPAAVQQGNIVDISAGLWHSVALTSDGHVVAWGGNLFTGPNVTLPGGQLDIPEDIQGKVVKVAAGYFYNIALLTNGSVVCWGFDAANETHVPSTLAGEKVQSVYAGQGTSAAILENGTVVQWGQFNEPPAVAKQVGLSQLSIGGDVTLGLLTNGTVVSWYNGDPSFADEAAVLSKIPPAATSRVISVAAAQDVSMALLDSGAVVTWGPRSNVVASKPPAAFRSSVLSIAAKNDYAMVLSADPAPTHKTWTGPKQGLAGHLVAWGQGIDSLANEAGGGDIIKVSAGGFHTLALTKSGNVSASGDTIYLRAKVPLAAQSFVVDIASGRNHSLALVNGTKVVAWGSNQAQNSQGKLVPGNQISVPKSIQGLKMTQVAAGGYHSMALLANGTVVCWGYNSQGQIDTPANAKSNVTFIAAGFDSSVALRNDGSVVAWGRTATLSDAVQQQGLQSVACGVNHCVGILKGTGGAIAWVAGTPTRTDIINQLLTVPPTAQSNVIEVAAGAFHSMALLDSGEIVIWGAISDVIPPAASFGVIGIAAGYNMSVALVADPAPRDPMGHAVQWGLAPGANLPTQTYGQVSKIGAGYQHAVALVWDNVTSGSSVGWGDSSFGQLPSAGAEVVDLCAGAYHTVTLFRNGTVYAQGSNTANINNVLQPGGQVDVPAGLPATITQIACGHWHTLVLFTNGSVFGWGYNEYQQLNIPAAARTGQVAVVGGGELMSWAILKNGTFLQWGKITDPAPDSVSREGVLTASAGRDHVLAVLPNNSMVAWTAGPPAVTNDLLAQIMQVPTAAQNASISAVSANQLHSVALTTQGTVFTWGAVHQSTLTVPAAATSGVLAVSAGIDYSLAIVQGYLPAPKTPSSPPPSGPAGVVSGPGGSSNGTTADQAAGLNASSELDSKKPLSTAAVAGIAVAGVVGLAAIVTAGAAFLRSHQRKWGSSGTLSCCSGPHPANESGTPAKSITTVVEFNSPAVSDGAVTLSRNESTMSPGSASTKVQDTPGRIVIPGLMKGDAFLRATAHEFSWFTATEHTGEMQILQSRVNDMQLDALLAEQPSAHTDDTEASACPVVQLSSAELKEQVLLCADGLMGRGGSALVFRCLWPSRFGSNAQLAVKVLKDGFEADMRLYESFAYEASVLASTNHPNVVRIYGFCLEPPTVCIIMELLPYSLKDILYKGIHSSSIQYALPSNTPPASYTNHSAAAATSSGMSRTGDFQRLAAAAGADGHAASHSESHTTTGSTTASNASAAVAAARAAASTNNTPSTSNPSTQHDVAAARTGESAGTFGKQQSGLPQTGSSLGNKDTDANAGSVSSSQPTLSSGQVATGRTLTCLQVVRISTDLAAGLAYLHAKDVPRVSSTRRGPLVSSLDSEAAKPSRIVHRDLKPGNVLFNLDGVAKICDFGLAREHENTTIATVHLGAGTLPYMAPELLVGANSGALQQKVTNRVDVYALAMLMWEMLAGHAPWKGIAETAILAAVITRQRPQLPIDELKEVAEVQARKGLASLANEPATLMSLPRLNAIIRACWNQRDLRRPTAAEAHQLLVDLLHQLEGAQPVAESVERSWAALMQAMLATAGSEIPSECSRTSTFTL